MKSAIKTSTFTRIKNIEILKGKYGTEKQQSRCSMQIHELIVWQNCSADFFV